MGLVARPTAGIRISMYTRGEHSVPHLHIRFQHFAASISIASRRILAGELPNPQRNRVKAWVAAHQDELSEMWSNRMQPGGIYRIETAPGV